MKSHYRGIIIGALQCLLVLTIAAKYSWDRETLPRAWARAAPVDPDLPIRGRYISLRLEVEYADLAKSIEQVRLSARNGKLTVEPCPFDTGVRVVRWPGNSWQLVDPVAYFIPEHVPDPSRRAPGEELWVEVSVPRRGPPRPIRLAVRKNGSLAPLRFR
jgi:uncharacterized membrane-anchored protein